MTEIGRVNKHKTTHQDGGNDEIVLTGILPGVHKTTHQDAGVDEIDTTGLAGRCDFVSRGDPSVWDFQFSDFPTGGDYADLSLASIIPVGTKAVLLEVQLQDDVVGTLIEIMSAGLTNKFSVSRCLVYIANVLFGFSLVTPVSSDRKITYWRTNVTFASLNLLVRGWWI